MDHLEFVSMVDVAIPTLPVLPPQSRLYVIAQAALESGWATSTGSQVHNYFNVSAGSEEHGRSLSWPVPKPVLVGLDKEPDGQGGWKPVHQFWRSYKDPAECLADYFSLLNWPRYQSARDSLLLGQGELFITYLGPDRSHQTPPIGGFYTLPTAQYLGLWRACLAEVQALVCECP